MTMRRTKRYTTQSFKKKELTGDDPYSMKLAPKGLLECPDCRAVFYRKRWSLPKTTITKTKAPTKAQTTKTTTQQVLIPQEFVCPACKKLRDGYAEGFINIQWENWGAHKADVLGLIHNEEHKAVQNNPLERVMTIRTRPDGADIETTTEHFAQRLGKHLDRAFKGSIQYRWSHKDKSVRITWKGPATANRKSRTTKKSKARTG